jgi:hypothetical protein
MTSPKEILQARGIAEQADLAGWQELDSDFWEYPVFAPDGSILGYRQKKMPHSTVKGFKYLWKGGKPENEAAQWYIQKDTIQAIKDAGGVCFLSNGEPAMLAYRAAGILNVIATTLSEVAVPKNALSYLRLIGVNRLIYIVDSDKAGVQSAINWRDSLAASGIDLEILAWPEILPAKSDANDALMYARALADKPQDEDYDPLADNLSIETAFANILKACYRPILPAQEAKAPKLAIDFKDFDRSPLVAAIGQALSSSGLLGRKVWQTVWQECHCPFHEDKEASAGFNLESGVLNCMGSCGKAYSAKAVAEKLGVNWKSFYPKSEGKKKPLKRDLSRFQEVLEQAPINTDMRSYADVISDEIAARIQAHEAGQYLGFGSWKDLPISIITAVLTLCNGRSNTAVFLGRLHEALRLGKLPSVCNYEMLCKALDLPYRIVFKACFELNALSFLPKLSGINNIESMMSMKSGKNSANSAKAEGRPCDWFLVELEKEEIKSLLIKQLEIYFLEKYARKALALPDMNMVSAYGLNEESALDYRNRIKATMNDSSNKAAKQAYDNEMFGDGTWKGWYKVIESDFVAPLNFAEYADASDLRVAILKWWTSKIRPVNSRDELCRLLGCSDATIDKLLDKANMINERQQTKLEFQVPATVKQMKFLWGKNQRDLSGKCWKGGFKLKGETAWQPIDEKNYLESYATYAGRIEKGYMLIITPSKQRPMNEDEIAARDEKLAQEAQEKAPQAPKEAKTEGSTVVRSQTAKIPEWTRHSYVFLYRQLQLLFHVFTDYSLGQKQAIVFDKQGSPITSGQLPALFTFFLSVASATPKRKVKSFYGKDYDESIDLEALQLLADSQMFLYGEMELEESEGLPISQKSMDFLEKPKLVTPKVKQETYDETWTWANHPEEFNERMRMIGAI